MPDRTFNEVHRATTEKLKEEGNPLDEYFDESDEEWERAIVQAVGHMRGQAQVVQLPSPPTEKRPLLRHRQCDLRMAPWSTPNRDERLFGRHDRRT